MSTTRLRIGDPAPEFTLPDDSGKPVASADYRDRKLIVYFYPAASTPGCTRETCDFEAALPDLRAAGYDVVGISPDTADKIAAFREEGSFSFPLLSDPDRTVLTEWGAYGEKQLYGKTVTGVIRSTFVIGSDGKLELAQYNVKATGHVDKLRRDLGI